jgi:hypothetical protein
VDRRILLVAVIGLAACDHSAVATRPLLAPAPDPVAVEQRGLTAAEVALLRPIYQDGIDYPTVRVIHDQFAPFEHPDRYVTPEGSIYAPGTLWHDDFAAPTVDAYTQAAFVHEMAHVWQFQNGMNMLVELIAALAANRGDYTHAYWYTLRPDTDLLDYGMEQQASILEDWFLVRVHRIDPSRMENVRPDPTERDALYAAILARFVADPTYARGVSADQHNR